MTRAVLLAMLVISGACGSSRPDGSEHHFTNKQQGYSIAQPDGRTVSMVRDAAQLSPTKNASKRKHTIVIRSSDKPREIKDGVPATDAAIVATTEHVLRALPRAKLSGETKLQGTELSATRFSLSFVPTSVTHPYHREHVVLVGSKHIYHVIYTSPADEPIDEASFARVIATLSEAG